jgi:hypothetical protein
MWNLGTPFPQSLRSLLYQKNLNTPMVKLFFQAVEASYHQSLHKFWNQNVIKDNEDVKFVLFH